MQSSMLSSRAIGRPVAPRQAARPVVRSRGALQVQAATLWSLQHKGKEIEITDTVGKKEVCTVQGKESKDCDKALMEVQGVDVQFIASGESDPVDSPSDLMIKNSNSEVPIKIDGAELGKGEEKKLSIGAKIDFGGQATYQVLRNVRTHA